MRILFAVILTLISAACPAVEYGQIHSEKSSITFISQQMGVPIDGKFDKYNARIAFDPDHPETAGAQVEIEMASIDAGNPDSNDEVRTKGWFDVERFKTAKFEASGFKARGAGTYEAAGKMTIKGVTQQVMVPFTVKLENNAATLEGLFPISRKQYGIGTADWLEVVGDEVKLLFRFNLGPLSK